MSKVRSLNEIARRETALHIASRAHLHLEAAVASLLDAYSVAQTAAVLREWAEQLEEFG